MSNSTRPTLRRIQEMLRRQDPPKWGPDYEPAIRASRDEAPACSRPSQVWAERLGRYCHVLSLVEQKALLLALYNPDLFELHEQRILSTEPRPHPLFNHPAATDLQLPGIRGTIDVCDRLDMIERHPRVMLDHPDGTGKVHVPIPFVGDFLLFLEGQHGPYCVNWTIKGSAREFNHPLLGQRPARNEKLQAANVRARHAIEERYYLDAGIRTVRVTGQDLPELFIQNLRSLVLTQHRAADVEPVIYAEVCERLQASISLGKPPLEILLSVAHRHQLPVELAQALFARALWRRDVRPELMVEAILIDQPLQPERHDPMRIFSAFFHR